jgi:two-component system sensor histidine kinase UhpB
MKPLYEELDILIVEDNPADLFLLKRMLKSSRLGIASLHAVSRMEEAKELLTRQKFHLVLLDLTLPDSYGIQSYLSIKWTNKNLPVIILTGMDDRALALDAIKQGAMDYLVKGEYIETTLIRSIQYSFERVQNIEALKESNERFNMAVKATNDVIWDFNFKTGQVFFEGDTFKRLFGYDLVNSSVHRSVWESWIHKEDRATIIKNIDQLPKKINPVNGTGQYQEYRFRMQKTDGSYAFVYSKGYILYNGGELPIRMIGAMQDITEKVKLEEELAKQQQLKQQEITAAVLTAQERERTMLGEELHDNINQILTGVTLFMGIAINNRDKRDELLVKCKENLAHATLEIRKLSRSLILPGLKGQHLVESMRELIRDTRIASTLEIKFHHEAVDETILTDDQKITIYRIAQEQLNNILKHAEASSVEIMLEVDEEEIVLNITDDGKGFDPAEERHGVGIRNITSRAELYNGKVEIETAPGIGCSLKVRMNIKKA